MKNAYQRFGTLEYTKRMKDTTTQVRLRVDRFIAEIEEERKFKLHALSVLGGDSDIGAIWAAIHEQSLFTLQGPGIGGFTAGLGEDAECFRGTITLAGRKPIRHLVGISAELGRRGRELSRKGDVPSCATTTHRLFCTASLSASGCRSCRSGPVGSKKSSAGERQSRRLWDWDARRCW